ncbi:MAG: polyprenyl synthetase family protein, partial [Shewanella sp.]
DDLLDYTANADELGKNIGDDLAEGKPTLPLIYAMEHGSDAAKKLIREAIEQSDGTKAIDEILAALDESGALAYTEEKAQLEAQKAIDALAVFDDSDYKQALISLAHLSVNRNN